MIKHLCYWNSHKHWFKYLISLKWLNICLKTCSYQVNDTPVVIKYRCEVEGQRLTWWGERIVVGIVFPGILDAVPHCRHGNDAFLPSLLSYFLLYLLPSFVASFSSVLPLFFTAVFLSFFLFFSTFVTPSFLSYFLPFWLPSVHSAFTCSLCFSFLRSLFSSFLSFLLFYYF